MFDFQCCSDFESWFGQGQRQKVLLFVNGMDGWFSDKSSVCLFRLCVWSISVPPGYSILLEFEHFDLESDSHCRYDRLTVSVGTHKPVGEVQTHIHIKTSMFTHINI